MRSRRRRPRPARGKPLGKSLRVRAARVYRRRPTIPDHLPGAAANTLLCSNGDSGLGHRAPRATESVFGNGAGASGIGS